MADDPPQQIKVFASAKINLYLHLTGKRPDGYHLLDSLIGFFSIGDAVSVGVSEGFSFHVDGPFAGSLSADERRDSTESGNIAVRAALATARAAGRTPDVFLHLTKNLPPAAGLGGGSSDAAVVVRGLLELWRLPSDADFLEGLLRSLGADVPVCFYGQAARISGIGEIIEPVPTLPMLPAVLVNPLKSCPTPEVFRRTRAAFKTPVVLPERFKDTVSFAAFLKETGNDLTDAALGIVPEVATCLEVLGEAEGCLLSRMSGSGATCFGIFESEPDALRCAQRIQADHPGWWVQAGEIFKAINVLCT